MLRILFLILIIISSITFAQTIEKDGQNENPKAYIFAELGKAKDSEVRKKIEEFSEKLREDKTSQGYIINYGKPKEVGKREKQIKNGINWRCDYDCPGISLANSTDKEELKSIFWIVPAGAETPTP